MEPLKHNISFLLNYTTRNMRRYASEVLSSEGAGVTIDQWGVLALLSEHGGKMTNGLLTEKMLKDRPTLTRIVDILCREGLVAREPDANDRRKMLIKLTRRGRSTITKVTPLVEEIRGGLTKGLTKKDREEMLRILGDLNRNIDALRELESK